MAHCVYYHHRRISVVGGSLSTARFMRITRVARNTTNYRSLHVVCTVERQGQVLGVIGFAD